VARVQTHSPTWQTILQRLLPAAALQTRSLSRGLCPGYGVVLPCWARWGCSRNWANFRVGALSLRVHLPLPLHLLLSFSFASYLLQWPAASTLSATVAQGLVTPASGLRPWPSAGPRALIHAGRERLPGAAMATSEDQRSLRPGPGARRRSCHSLCRLRQWQRLAGISIKLVALEAEVLIQGLSGRAACRRLSPAPCPALHLADDRGPNPPSLSQRQGRLGPLSLRVIQ
jgi:hypothetical protein